MSIPRLSIQGFTKFDVLASAGVGSGSELTSQMRKTSYEEKSMKPRYIFSESQIGLFKRQAHVIRDTLRLYKKERTPSVTKMQDIWATCLGYSDYQTFIRHSKGHSKTLENPVSLTDASFIAR
jgi:hypothetical protein